MFNLDFSQIPLVCEANTSPYILQFNCGFSTICDVSFATESSQSGEYFRNSCGTGSGKHERPTHQLKLKITANIRCRACASHHKWSTLAAMSLSGVECLKVKMKLKPLPFRSLHGRAGHVIGLNQQAQTFDPTSKLEERQPFNQTHQEHIKQRLRSTIRVLHLRNPMPYHTFQTPRRSCGL